MNFYHLWRQRLLALPFFAAVTILAAPAGAYYQCGAYTHDDPQTLCDSFAGMRDHYITLEVRSGSDGPYLGWMCHWKNGSVWIDDPIAMMCDYWTETDNPFNWEEGCDPLLYRKSLGESCQSYSPVRGNPVTVCSGNKFQKTVDYQGGGAFPLSFVRYYNSQTTRFRGVMGIGWRHGFERFLYPKNSSRWIATRPDGRGLEFYKSGSNWYSYDADIKDKLAASGSDFILTLVNGDVETYDSSGVLQAIEYRGGYTQTLTYNGTTGLLEDVTDSFGRTIEFTYDADGLLETMTDAAGEEYFFTYVEGITGIDGTPILETVTYPDDTVSVLDNPVVTYNYDDATFPLYLTSVDDELGNTFATWTYDSLGRVIESVHAGGADETDITYNVDGTKTVTGPLGEQLKYTFSVIRNAPRVTRIDRLAVGSIPAAYQTFSYTSNGFLNQFRDWSGNITTYTFGSTTGLETSRTEAYGTGQARTITTTWDTTKRLPTQINYPTQQIDFTYNADGKMLTYKQTDLQTQSTPYSTYNANRTWTYTYDGYGNILTADGPRTDVTDTTTYTYDGTTYDLENVENALGHDTQITSYDARGLPLSVTDPNGLVIDFTYDEMGRVETITENATAGDRVKTFTYDLAGQLEEIEFADSTTLTYEYDDAHRLEAVENSRGERIEYTLDDAGNITLEEMKNAGSTLRMKQSRTFDELGRLIASIGAVATQDTLYDYDDNSNLTDIEDPLGNATERAFDALNRLITQTDPLTNDADTGYDARSNPTSQEDFAGNATTYVYNGYDQVIQKTSPETGTTVYTLDKAGNVTSETDARSVVTNRTFDAINRVTAVSFPSYSSENMTFSYDSTTSGNSGIGRLTGFTDQSGSTTFFYSDVGDMTETVRTIESEPYTTSYSYNSVGQVTQVVYPSGRIVDYTYDAYGDLTTVATKPDSMGSSSTLASSITFEPFGPVKSFTFGNSLDHSRDYDQNYWVEDIVTEDGATHIQDLDLAYDDAGNLTDIMDNIAGGLTQGYVLDELWRIEEASGAYGTIDYTYDDAGNRLVKYDGTTMWTSTIAGGSNKLSSMTDGSVTRSFTYDAAGNMTADDRGSDPDVTFTYGGRGRLLSVTVGGSTTVDYKLNALGQRVVKDDGTDVTHYHYDEAGHLIAESEDDGTLIREYVWMGDLPLAQIEAAGTIYYVHTDHLNAPRRMTDSGQSVVWSRDQEPFGEDYASSGAANMSLRFPGQFADPESGLSQNWMRDYDPSLGRYIQADPLGQNGGLNLYSYANQNPARYVDPRGENPLLIGATVPVLSLRLSSDASSAGQYTPGRVDSYRLGMPAAEQCIPDAGFTEQKAWENFPTMGDYLNAYFFDNPYMQLAVGAAGGWALSAFGATAGAASEVAGASRAASARGGVELAKQLAKREQIAQLEAGGGKVIAGSEHAKKIRDVNRLVSTYGGKAEDWQKVVSGSRTLSNGLKVETHGYYNTATKTLYEPELKLRSAK